MASEIFEVGRFTGLLDVPGQNLTLVVQVDEPGHTFFASDFLILLNLDQTVFKQYFLALVVVKIKPFFTGLADTAAYLQIIRTINELSLR